MVDNLSETAEVIDQNLTTQANKGQALVNAIINVLNRKMKNGEAYNMNYENVLKAVMNYKFPDPSKNYLENRDVLSTIFNSPEPYFDPSKYKYVWKLLKKNTPDTRKYKTQIEDLIKAFFDSEKALEQYYEDNHKFRDKYSPLSEKQLNLLKDLQTKYLLEYHKQYLENYYKTKNEGRK